MKLVSYLHKELGERAGYLQHDHVLDLALAESWAQEQGRCAMQRPLPVTMAGILEAEGSGLDRARAIAEATAETPAAELPFALPLSEAHLLAPLPRPRSFRDFYAFEEHVKTARGRRGLDMVPEWYDFPVFYFSNHNAFVGPDADVECPAYTEWLDYELEIACVIGKTGRDIKPEEAAAHIAGFAVLNDWSARDVQREEVKVGLGPAKGKDFATSMGPYLLTLDELEDVRDGDRWQLTMTAKVNGQELSRGNFGTIYFSFAELIARASDGVTLYPGDVIGSGTVGTGCILELGTEVHRWLVPGDVVELEIERLGVLKNRVK
ncbi:fumarylacetoacetate (FAA) hydrolase [Tumebacillus sp. BK434]|uniref:fumarylacetoacetate hydrolase family protein n=1 Tax=Tumebacillus sp. BK434 TaxID=2512169 RepID=UPI001046ABE2|nr:fumarylacetoacetate hydrolase family protein [Tumebacillus sp. BK434]TCP55647.1 fumarylacetoacetate (FAA) hydrolase [Tumebacillus sp. BK434]